MQAIWKGHISFGLVTVPISLYAATTQQRVSLRMLHKKDNSPVVYKKFCEREERELAKEDIVKGYEVDDGRFVVLTNADMEKVDVKLTKTINIINFASVDEIDPIWCDRPYYLEPREGGQTPYELLRRALIETGNVGICKTVIKNREHLACLTPRSDILVLEVMRFSAEVRNPDKLEKPADVKVEGKQLDLAKELINKMAEPFYYNAYKDEYSEKLLDMIHKKAEGKKITAPRKKKAPEVENLLEALEKSLHAA